LRIGGLHPVAMEVSMPDYDDMVPAFEAAVAALRETYGSSLALLEIEMTVERTSVQIEVTLAPKGGEPVPHTVKMGSFTATRLPERLAYLKAAMDHIARLIDETLVHQGAAPRQT
jgi:hypothetical protein